MALKLKTLARLQFRQLSRNKSTGRLYSDIFGVLFFWIIEFVLFFLLKEDGTSVPPVAVALVTITFTIPDVIIKFILERDNTVMDAFLKTRPSLSTSIPRRSSSASWQRLMTFPSRTLICVCRNMSR